jgi:hypothetical protein
LNEYEAEQKEDGKLRVDFYKAPVEDFVPTHGAHLDANETPKERIEQLKALGCRIRQHPKEADILIVEKCGRPVFREETFIRIQRPGDRDLINERPVEEHDKVRFAKRWAQHEAGADTGVIGTPLTELPFINTAMREEFAYFGVITAEQLVGMSDANAAKFPYMSKVRPRVQRYLDEAQAEAPFKERDAKMAGLEATVAALQAQLAAMSSSPPPSADAPEEPVKPPVPPAMQQGQPAPSRRR